MSLIHNLNGQNLELYNLIKNKVLQNYPLYHRQASFGTNKGLIAFVDKTLARYSALILNNSESIVKKSISNISSIASTEKDAVTMAKILYSFISNCEATMVNGSLKAFNYAIEYVSLYSDSNWKTIIPMSILLGSFINNAEYKEKYDLIYAESRKVFSNVKADVLFTILSAIFAYTRKLMVYFYRYFSNDKQLGELSYKSSIPVLQNQLESLLSIFIESFYNFFYNIFNKFNEFVSGFYLNSIDENTFININTNISLMYSNNLYSLEDSPEEINKTLISDISSIYDDLIVDTTEFSEFIESIDDDGFINDKNLLAPELAKFLGGK